MYYRFSEVMLLDMLHLHYRGIKACHESKQGMISQEITNLQTISTKDKRGMPEYLKYCDRGYMYNPNSTFIPFFCVALRSLSELIPVENDLERLAAKKTKK